MAGKGHGGGVRNGVDGKKVNVGPLVAAAEEDRTIPVVHAVTRALTSRDRDHEARLQAAHLRAADAEAGRRAAQEQLDGGRQWPTAWASHLAQHKHRAIIVRLIVAAMIVVTTAAGIVLAMLCRQGQCRRSSWSASSSNQRAPTPTTTPTMTASSSSSPPSPAMLSPRAEFILDYINNITLTGRTLLYPDTTTPEGRALAWLIDVDVAMSTSANRTHVRQRYALATWWFTTPPDRQFDSPFALNANRTWVNPAVDECEWLGVTCLPPHGEFLDLLLLGSVSFEVSWLQLEETGVRDSPIPPDLGLLTNLVLLSSPASRLKGTIPSSLGSHLTSLTSLFLQANALTGPIPTSLSSMTKLQELLLHDNALNGTIPPALGNSLTTLTVFTANDNPLTGTIPSSLGMWSSLEYLHLSSISLSGTIPSSFGSLTSLRELGLVQTGLTGTIPSELSSLTALVRLQLAVNYLNGTIPSNLGSLTALTEVLLSNNALTGTIPSSLGSLTSLMVLMLKNNKLTGTVPTSSLEALTSLIELDLYNNQVLGTMPFCAGNGNGTNRTFDFLIADCNEVVCPCCTHCCPKGGWDGIPEIPSDRTTRCHD